MTRVTNKIPAKQMPRTKTMTQKISKDLITKNEDPKKTMPLNDKNSLGKDSFLKLLVTQLRHQDPTKPMEDREFISQMAQFSALEQMTNLNKEMSSMNKSFRSSEAYGLLGKEIDAYNPVKKLRVSGTVTSIKLTDGGIKLVVGKEEVSMNDVHAIRNTAKNSQ